MHERLLAWDIRDGDAVIVIGGYQGATCKVILERYPWCQLHTWEPQEGMYGILVEALKPWPNAHAYNHGLGIENGSFPMTKTGSDFCSFAVDPGEAADAVCEMREFGEEMDRLGIQEIAWLHLNIEGYEYFLMPYLVRTGWMEKIGQLVLATHGCSVVDERTSPIGEIHKMMEWTHKSWWSQRQFIAWSRPDREMQEVPELSA